MKALLCGSFDPPTLGHLNIIQRAAKICDHLIVGIAENPNKEKAILGVSERAELLRELTKDNPGIEVINFSGLTSEFAKKKNVDVLIRGIRTASDMEFEFQMAAANRQMINIETIFLMADGKYSHLSSSLIKEILQSGGNLTGFVPEVVEKKLKGKKI